MDNKTIYQGRVYKASSGQWSWAIAADGVDVVNGAGYESEADALDGMQSELAVYTEQPRIVVTGERDPSYRSRPANDGGTYYLLPDDEHLLQAFEQDNDRKDGLP
ncbi:hypothetical protein PO883_33335 [Massilia sp. DJPM01]|uniref:hypothetical protein n=1 Tax=Massilia sp. DJPM01 TaxID=3024404 RepID=UPI00259D74FA|nr:hypothetical protein [Massilia sp. DJPM01]MDM5182059.1 hypothetical protein [Massilia sp. DJPM01]